MPRKAGPPPKAADWPPEKTLAALKKQLSALNHLSGRQYNEAEYEETAWKNLTLNILTHGFGEGSNNVNQFYSARNAGEYYMYEMHPSLHQSNFFARINALKATLDSSIAELEMMLPEAELAGAYEQGAEYLFYKDLKTIVGFASKELFVIDNYLDNQLFDVYMEKVGPVQVRVLTQKVSDSLKLVAEKFAKRGGFELKSSNGAHDRVLFAGVSTLLCKRPGFVFGDGCAREGGNLKCTHGVRHEVKGVVAVR